MNLVDEKALIEKIDKIAKFLSELYKSDELLASKLFAFHPDFTGEN